MNIIVDTRETGLIPLLENKHADIQISQENLNIGDIHLCKPDGTTLMIFERKTIQDLAASIRDGRYKEQGLRLTHSSVPNHHIVFIIEGNIENYQPNAYTKQPLQQSALYSSIVSTLYYKGFSVLQTKDLVDTGKWILRFADKMIRSKDTPYYDMQGEQGSNTQYIDHIKMKKQSNITPENIDEIMLCQIPGISCVIANAILNDYSSLKIIIDTLVQNPAVFDDFTYYNKQGKVRKIPKNVISNIKTYLKISQ